DGNDYWIWDAIEAASPRVVVIETNIELGDRDVVFPYDPAYAYPGEHPKYHGASVEAMQRLGEREGYRMVSSNRVGFNTIHVREDEAGRLERLDANELVALPYAVANDTFDAVSGYRWLSSDEAARD